jgi:hypothetical protein
VQVREFIKLFTLYTLYTLLLLSLSSITFFLFPRILVALGPNRQSEGCQGLHLIVHERHTMIIRESHDTSVPAQLAQIQKLLDAGHSEAAVRLALEAHAADMRTEALHAIADAIQELADAT